MKTLRQIGALTASGLRSIPDRLGASLVTVIGTATVVAVLTAMLSVSEGVKNYLAGPVKPNEAFVFSENAPGLLQSSLPREAMATVAQAPGIMRGADGKPRVTGSSIAPIDVLKKTNERGNVFILGMTEPQLEDAKLIEGRWHRPGVREVVVSDAVRKVYRGFELGDRVTTRGSEWVVVGVFEEAGHTYDQTIVTDLETMLSAFGRNTIQQISVVLVSPDDFPRFKEWLENDPTLDVDVLDPREYRRRTVGQLTNLIDFVSYFIGALMASGAICAALSSLYAAVDSRRREIATLRAIGFGAMPVVISVLLEGLLLAFGAALLGALIAWLFFNGNVVSTVGLTFPLDVSPRLVAVAIVWALAIGLLGGLLPAVRAACLPVAAALRDA